MSQISAQLVIQHAECQYRCHAKIRIAKLGRNSSRLHMQKSSNVRYRNAHAELKTKSLHNLAERTSYEHPTIIHATFAPNSPDVYNNVASNFDKRVCRFLRTANQEVYKNPLSKFTTMSAELYMTSNEASTKLQPKCTQC